MQPKHPYHEPIWSSEYQGDGPPYTLEIIKQGVSKGLISPNKKYLTIGRLPSSDIEIEHESASRNHAVIQYSKEYCFIYDLGSSHGSFLNKARVNPKEYIRVYNGDRLRFGASTRVFLLHGPKQNDRIITNTNNNANTNTRRVQNQRSWGDQEDAYEGNGWSSKFPSQTLDRKTLTKQEPYHQDPKHYISNFVSNNKVELVIEYTGKNIIECLLEINGLIGVFECKGKGKSKAVAEKDACMEACWKLSQMDILESTDQGMSDVQQRKRLLDKLGDDDQGFFDRTEKKLKVDVVEDFDSLSLKKNECEKEIDGLEVLIKSVLVKSVALDEDDDLDAYMNQIEEKVMNDNCVSLQQQVDVLKIELQRVDRLLKIVAPKFKNTPKALSLERVDDLKVPKALSPKRVVPKSPTKQSIDQKSWCKPKEPKNPKKVVKGPRKEEMELHVMLQKEEEDVFDFLPPDERESKEIEKLKHAYGY